MDVVRRFSILATAVLLGIAVMLGSVNSRPALSASAATQLEQAASYFDSTIGLARGARPMGARGDALAISLGYLERMRLGLGEPFRLVDEALHDNRLDSAASARVAWALLARLRRGDAYNVDPVVLDGAGPWAANGHGATGAAHLALIDHAIRDASDPRVGELTVRLAYLIESGKGTLSPSAAGIATQVAALLRDRALAEDDLRDALADANQRHVDVPALIVERRANLSLRVEQPALAPLTSKQRIEAMDDVPTLVSKIDSLDRPSDVQPATRPSTPALGELFAARLEILGDSQPPRAPVVVTLRGHPKSGLHATNDETLAAAYVPAALAPDSARRVSAIALLSAAVALRTTAQDKPWFSGEGGPLVSDLSAEFGLVSVKFARTVPAAWRPFYLRELQTGLRDMQEVYPAFAFTGLHVELGTSGLPDSALAMHDPRSRTLELSIETSGGTLAHELSHDLDWQTAQRMFAVAGGYSTDRAWRENRGALASSMRGLAEARFVHPMGGSTAAASADRPAELFARGSDWFTASVLAQQGRMNGFLSAVQDATLSGYAAGVPSAIGAAGVGSLSSAIDQMTFVPDSVRDIFVSQWSDPDVTDPVLLVRRVLETPVSWRGTWRSNSPIVAMLPAPRAAVCIAESSDEAKARERLLMLAVDVRARSAAWRRARYRPNSLRAATANGLLGIAPWTAESGEDVVEALRSAIIADLSSNLSNQGLLPVVPSIFRSSAETCDAVSR